MLRLIKSDETLTESDLEEIILNAQLRKYEELLSFIEQYDGEYLEHSRNLLLQSKAIFMQAFTLIEEE